jgi:hypothetical protein
MTRINPKVRKIDTKTEIAPSDGYVGACLGNKQSTEANTEVYISSVSVDILSSSVKVNFCDVRQRTKIGIDGFDARCICMRRLHDGLSGKKMTLFLRCRNGQCGAYMPGAVYMERQG